MGALHRIMVVDDEDDIRDITAQVLSTHYEVVTANDGIDALAKLETHEPDLFLLDILMPVMDGFRTCVAIRRHPRFGEAQVLFCSGMDDPEHVKKAYATGGNFFISKPIDPDRLIKNIEITLRGHAAPIAKQYTLDELEKLPPEMLKPPEVAEPEAPPEPKAVAAEPQVAAPQPATFKRENPFLREDKPEGGPERPRVFLVDDDEDIRFVISTALQSKFEVVTAFDGHDAISRLMEIEPDLMLLDIMMPRVNGYDVCASLRRTSRFKDLPVIFMSAASSDASRAKARKVGATDFLGKPCSIDIVFAATDKVINDPSFQIRPKRKRLEELLSPEHAYDLKRRRNAAVKSVQRDYGAFQKFIESKFMDELK